MTSSATTVDVQKRARSACTTFRALRAEWEDVRGETQDALTVMANASLELEGVDDLCIPTSVDDPDLRKALKAKRAMALDASKERVAAALEDVADIRADFEKLANADRYFGSSLAQYPDDGPLFKSLTFGRFRDAFSRAAKLFVTDIKAKETLIKTLIDRGENSKLDREDALVIISAYALDPLIDQEALDEFDALIIRGEL